MNICLEGACQRVEGHSGECADDGRTARHLDKMQANLDMLAEMRRLNASLSALPPVLNAIAGGVMAGIGPSFAGPQGEPLTLADLADAHECSECGWTDHGHAHDCPRRTA